MKVRCEKAITGKCKQAGCDHHRDHEPTVSNENPELCSVVATKCIMFADPVKCVEPPK